MLMVQSNTQVPMNRAKLKGPPPVPPRPNQNAVVEALAKTRKAAADSKSNIPKCKPVSGQKLKTLDKNATPPAATPKINGLARVKSFIRDVINSSDEKKSFLQESKKAKELNSSNSSVSSKSSPDSGKSKTIKQSLVRSLSTSMKLEQENKRVSKSSSFAEKSLPYRRAPPPPLSPKPKLRQLRQYVPPSKYLSGERPNSSQKRNSLDSDKNEPICNETAQIDKSQEIISEKTREEIYNSEEPILKASLSLTTVIRQNSLKSNKLLNRSGSSESKKSAKEEKTACVTDMLISEILASQNRSQDISKNSDQSDLLDEMNALLGESLYSNQSEELKDLNNHEKLIYELQEMKKEDSFDKTESEYENVEELSDLETEVLCEKISDEEAHLYTCNIDDELRSRLRNQLEVISRMPLSGLPPLPKCLSGFTINSNMKDNKVLSNDVRSGKEESHSQDRDMDPKLALLKKEMAELRSLDLSLLSELWSLSESMISWRHQLERSPRLRPAPPPPPPPARTS